MLPLANKVRLEKQNIEENLEFSDRETCETLSQKQGNKNLFLAGAFFAVQNVNAILMSGKIS